MEEMKLTKLMNRITVRRYVNLHAGGNTLDPGTITNLMERIGKMDYPKYCIAIDIKDIRGKDEKEEAGYLKELINEKMSEKQFPHWLHEANTIDGLLHHLNDRLEDPALIIFYQFTSPNIEKEKDLLRSIRKFIQFRDSFLLGLLLISNQELHKWSLHPLSDLNERFVEFFSYQ